MPATKNANAKTTQDPFQAPVEAAKKILEGLKPNFEAFTGAFDADAVRTQVIDGIKQVNQVTLDAATAVSEAVAKVVPTQSFPFAAEIRNAAKANIEFFGQIATMQREFAAELFAKFVPANA